MPPATATVDLDALAQEYPVEEVDPYLAIEEEVKKLNISPSKQVRFEPDPFEKLDKSIVFEKDIIEHVEVENTGIQLELTPVATKTSIMQFEDLEEIEKDILQDQEDDIFQAEPDNQEQLTQRSERVNLLEEKEVFDEERVNEIKREAHKYQQTKAQKKKFAEL